MWSAILLLYGIYVRVIMYIRSSLSSKTICWTQKKSKQENRLNDYHYYRGSELESNKSSKICACYQNLLKGHQEGSVKLILTKLINFLSLEQFYQRPIGVYGGVL